MLNGCPDRLHLHIIILHSGHSRDSVFKVTAVNQKADRCSADLVQAFGCAYLGIIKRRKVNGELISAILGLKILCFYIIIGYHFL